MILSSFTASALYGYLDFNVRFNERLSFLTGINGSGKTTILNCVQALITPDLGFLQGVTYEFMRLSFIDDANNKVFIEARQSDANVTLQASGLDATFPYARYIPDAGLPTFRQAEGETEHYRDLMATSTGHPLMEFIAALPTPMFLGLDRRARLAADDRRPGYAYRPRYVPATVRKPSRSMLGISLNEAEDLAIDAYRDARISSGRVGDELQQQLILNLLTLSPDDSFEIALPTEAEKQTLAQVQNDLESFPAIFHLSSAEVFKRVKPFLQHLEKVLQDIPSNATVSFMGGSGQPPPYLSSLLRWSMSKSQIKKIAIISQVVSTYNERRSTALRPFENYKNLVNGFLKDSGKSINIGEDGRSILVTIKGIKEARPLSSLSSGEAQIFVILTNLAFGPAAQRANVFIIDEPELSLHLRWQEMFVDSVLSANSNTQFIMATHSPSIILERTQDCIDIIPKQRRSRRA